MTRSISKTNNFAEKLGLTNSNGLHDSALPLLDEIELQDSSDMQTKLGSRMPQNASSDNGSYVPPRFSGFDSSSSSSSSSIKSLNTTTTSSKFSEYASSSSFSSSSSSAFSVLPHVKNTRIQSMQTVPLHVAAPVAKEISTVETDKELDLNQVKQRLHKLITTCAYLRPTKPKTCCFMKVGDSPSTILLREIQEAKTIAKVRRTLGRFFKKNDISPLSFGAMLLKELVPFLRGYWKEAQVPTGAWKWNVCADREFVGHRTSKELGDKLLFDSKPNVALIRRPGF